MKTSEKIKVFTNWLKSQNWLFDNSIKCQYIGNDSPNLNLYKGDILEVIGVNMYDELILKDRTFTLSLNEVIFK